MQFYKEKQHGRKCNSYISFKSGGSDCFRITILGLYKKVCIKRNIMGVNSIATSVSLPLCIAQSGNIFSYHTSDSYQQISSLSYKMFHVKHRPVDGGERTKES